MISVLVEIPCKEHKIGDIIDFLMSEEGLSITRKFKGFVDVETSVSEDGNTLFLYEKWNEKEDHLAYDQFRTDSGIADFLGPRIAGPVSVTYANCIAI